MFSQTPFTSFQCAMNLKRFLARSSVTKSNYNCTTMLYNGLETYVTAILKNQKFTNFDITTYKISSHTYP